MTQNFLTFILLQDLHGLADAVISTAVRRQFGGMLWFIRMYLCVLCEVTHRIKLTLSVVNSQIFLHASNTLALTLGNLLLQNPNVLLIYL